LRIKYTNITGYFIEISKNQVSKVPDSFVYKQTLVNASRYITEELKGFEKEIIE
jgi:DNA mismatch repair protein MutS